MRQWQIPDPEGTSRRDLSAGADVSDLIGVKATLWLPLWLLATILSFFLVGVIVALVGTLATLALLMNAVRRADTSD